MYKSFSYKDYYSTKFYSIKVCSSTVRKWNQEVLCHKSLFATAIIWKEYC